METSDVNEQLIRARANDVAVALDADVFLFNSGMSRIALRRLRECLRSRRRRTNVFLMLTTEGGDPNAAYLIARRLRDSYDRVIVCVSGWCKSAGTLLVIGADEIVMGDDGELGPLDVQIAKRDELDDAGSGLVVTDALSEIEENALNAWRAWTLDIVGGSGRRVTFKTAAEIATRLTVGLFSQLYSQIDPIYMGEARRLMNVGKEYGERLRAESGNISEAMLDKLVSGYPDHGFAIERSEAETIFRYVSSPTFEQAALINCLGRSAWLPLKTPIIDFLSSERSDEENEGETSPADEQPIAIDGRGESVAEIEAIETLHSPAAAKNGGR